MAFQLDLATRFNKVRVVTWNLWWRFGPWEERQPAILTTLENIDADIICLQEVWSEENGVDQAAEIAAKLNMHHVRTPEHWYKGHSFGNAILSKFPIQESSSHQLPPLDGPGRRYALTAKILREEKLIPVVCTHLDHRFDLSSVRQTQVKAVLELVDELRDLNGFPVVLAGDFNSIPTSDEIRLLTGESPPPIPGLVMSDAWPQCQEGPGYTWDRNNPYVINPAWPQRRLDYIFISWPRPKPLGNPTATYLAGDKPINGVIASDHYAVVSDLHWE